MTVALLFMKYMNSLCYSDRCTQGITHVAKGFRIEESSTRFMALGKTLRTEETPFP